MPPVVLTHLNCHLLSEHVSGAWAEREREVVGMGTERWAGKICRSKSAPP